jgi:hypothetical protein
MNNMISLESFPKIDAHFHSTSYNPVYEKFAKEYNVRYVNINTDTKIFPSIEDQERVALTYIEKHKECFAYIASFEMDNWESDDWYQNVFAHIYQSVEKGAVGIKIWKNIGMEIIKSSDQSYLMIDDLFFDPLFKFLSEHKIPVLSHLGEPKNCWLPLEKRHQTETGCITPIILNSMLIYILKYPTMIYRSRQGITCWRSILI